MYVGMTILVNLFIRSVVARILDKMQNQGNTQGRLKR